MRRVAVVLGLLVSGCGSRIDLSPGAEVWALEAGAPDAGPPDTAPDAPPVDRRILPLSPGRKWSFDVQPVGDAGSTTCAFGVQHAFVLGEATVQDQPAIRYQPVCDPFAVDVVGSGDRLVAYSTDGSNVSWLWMDTPVADGHTWQVEPGSTAVWHAVGTVNVWAGTFDDCFRRDEPMASAPTWVIYCRGVGPVRYHIGSDGWQAELVGKNF